jgi:DNA repair exonuclease SbcCD nuclease subunit
MANKKQAIGVFITDTHLSTKTIEINKSVFRQADDLAQKLGVQLFHGGDAFNSRKSQTLDVLVAFNEILDSLKSVLHIIPGNHDKISYRSVDSYLDPFMHHPKVRVYRMVGGIPIGDVTIHMLPYFLEEDKYGEMLKDMVESEVHGFNDKNVLLTHVAITGVKNNDASVVVNNVTQDLFEKFDLVLIGHYHDKSEVGRKMVYIGSTHQANFGENTKKGATILYNDLSFETGLFEFPKYVVEKINLDELTTAQIDGIHQHHAGSDDFVRFKFSGSEEKLKALDKTRFHEDIERAIDGAANGELVRYNVSSIKDVEFVEFCENNSLDRPAGEKHLLKHLSDHGL